MEDQPKSALLVDSKPRNLELILSHERLRALVSLPMDKATSAARALEAINKKKYDVLITTVMRGYRGEILSTGISTFGPIIMKRIGAMKKQGDRFDHTASIPEGLALLSELAQNKYQDMRPYYPILVDRDRSDGLVSFRSARKAIETGCFEFLNWPTPADFEKTFQRMSLLYPSPGKTGQVYVICGTKCVGKSAILNYLQKYVPRLVRIKKYSSRPFQERDGTFPDTQPMQQFPGDPSTEIHWESYGNTYCIPVDNIQQTLAGGNDCGIAIGQYKGVESVRRFFPQAPVFFVEMKPELIEDLLLRREKQVEKEQVLKVQDEFQRRYVSSRINNLNFFNVAREITNQIRAYRSSR